MTQTLDPTVAALQESVRHNEKNIDRLDRSLNNFRSEVLQRFNKLKASIDDRFNKIETKMDDRFRQTNLALLTLVGFIISGVGIIVAAIKLK